MLTDKQREDRQEWWSGLLWIEYDRGYAPGYATKSYRKLFKVWPSGLNDHLHPPSDKIKSWVKGQLKYFHMNKHKRGTSHSY